MRTKRVPAGVFAAAALIALFGTGALPAEEGRGPGVGGEAPDFTLESVTDGSEHSLADHRGEGPVVLVFFRGAW